MNLIVFPLNWNKSTKAEGSKDLEKLFSLQDLIWTLGLVGEVKPLMENKNKIIYNEWRVEKFFLFDWLVDGWKKV